MMVIQQFNHDPSKYQKGKQWPINIILKYDGNDIRIKQLNPATTSVDILSPRKENDSDITDSDNAATGITASGITGITASGIIPTVTQIKTSPSHKIAIMLHIFVGFFVLVAVRWSLRGQPYIQQITQASPQLFKR